MSGSNQKTLIYELEPDQKAYIYQQVAEFVPFFLPDSDVKVIVEKDSVDGLDIYDVTMVLSGGGSFVKSVGQGDTIFEASKQAKEELLGHLNEIKAHLSADIEDVGGSSGQGHTQ